MRILHVNLAKGFRGGERQTLLLIRELASLGLEQGLVCRRDSPMRPHLADIPDLILINAEHQLAGHFAAFNADIVHAHEAKAVHWAWLHFGLKKTPYVITRRVDTPIKDKWLNRQSYAQAAARVAISQKINMLLAERRWGKVTLIPSALAHLKADPDVTRDFRDAFAGQFLVGHAGALVNKHKGQLILIEAARQLTDRYPSMHFLFFGQGEDEAKLKAAAADLRNVSWMGFRSNIADYLAGLDVFAFPSLNEGLGSTLLDVMDCGVPIVASDVGGIPDIVHHEQTGLLVPVNDSDALAQAIERLYLDQDLCKKLIENAQLLLIDYTPEAMARRYYDIYKRALNVDS